VHRFVARDHHARGDIADHTGEEDHRVDHGDWQHDVQRIPAIRHIVLVQESNDCAGVVLMSRADGRDVDHGTWCYQFFSLRGFPGSFQILKDRRDVYRCAREHLAFLIALVR